MEKQIPTYPGSLPKLGHVFKLVRNPLKFVDQVHDYGPVTKIKVGPMKIVYVSDEKLLTELLINKSDLYSGGIQYEAMKPIVGEGIVTTEGSLHRAQRGAILPSLSKKSVERYSTDIKKIINQTLNEMGDEQEIDDVKLWSISLACKIAVRIIFGIEDVPKLSNVIGEALPIYNDFAAINTLDQSGIVGKLPFGIKRKLEKINGKLDAILYPIIEEILKDPKHDNCIIAHIAKAHTKQGFSRKPIKYYRDQAVTLLLASSETTASIITWACIRLAQSGELQKNCRDDLKSMLIEDERVPLTEKELLAGNRLDHLILECLRMYPPTYILTRKAKRNGKLGEWKLDEGDILAFSLYALHRDRKEYQKRHCFDITRWDYDVKKEYYRPFGQGPKKCPGESLAYAEIGILLRTLLEGWELSLVASDIKVNPVARTTLVPEKATIRFKRSTKLINANHHGETQCCAKKLSYPNS